MTKLHFINNGRSIRYGLFFGALALLGGCGGEVTSSGGSGGSGGAGGAGGSSGTTNPTGGGTMQACLDWCHKTETSNCMTQVGDCTDFCTLIYKDAGPECADELDAMFGCWLPLAATCSEEPPAACQAEVDAFEACQEAFGCGPSTCSGGGGPDGEACSCSQECAMKTYDTACSIDASGSSCECKLNGMVVGTCQGMTSGECSIQDGCCAQFFSP